MKRTALALLMTVVVFAASGLAEPAKAQAAPGYFSFSVGGPGYGVGYGAYPPYGPNPYFVPPGPRYYAGYPYGYNPYRVAPYGAYYRPPHHCHYGPRYPY